MVNFPRRDISFTNITVTAPLALLQCYSHPKRRKNKITTLYRILVRYAEISKQNEAKMVCKQYHTGANTVKVRWLDIVELKSDQLSLYLYVH